MRYELFFSNFVERRDVRYLWIKKECKKIRFYLAGQFEQRCRKFNLSSNPGNERHTSNAEGNKQHRITNNLKILTSGKPSGHPLPLWSSVSIASRREYNSVYGLNYGDGGHFVSPARTQFPASKRALPTHCFMGGMRVTSILNWIVKLSNQKNARQLYKQGLRMFVGVGVFILK